MLFQAACVLWRGCLKYFIGKNNNHEYNQKIIRQTNGIIACHTRGDYAVFH